MTAHGSGDVYRSKLTYVDPYSSIFADSVLNGNGGKVVVWADENTYYYGNIFARGGSSSGNGGNIEVSGKQNLNFNGNVNTTAANGLTGNTLLDPNTIEIEAGAGGTPAINYTGPFTPFTTSGPSYISQNALQAVAATSNLSLTASDGITLDSLGGGSLALLTTAAGSVTFNADNSGAGSGVFSMNASDTISTNGGAITIEGAGITLGTLNTTLSSGHGNITLKGDGATANITATGLTASTGAISITTPGSVTVTGTTGSSTGTISVNALGAVSLSGITATGAITIDAGAQGTYNAGAEASSVSLSGATIKLANVFSTGNISLFGNTITYTGGDYLDGTGYNLSKSTLTTATTSANVSSFLSAINSSYYGPITIGSSGYSGAITITSLSFDNEPLSLNTTGKVTATGTGINNASSITIDEGSTTYSAGSEANTIALIGSTLNLGNIYSTSTISLTGDTVNYGGVLAGTGYTLSKYTASNAMAQTDLSNMLNAVNTSYYGPVTLGSTTSTGPITITSFNFGNKALTVNTKGAVNLSGVATTGSITIDEGSGTYTQANEASSITISGTGNLTFGHLYTNSGPISLTSTGNISDASTSVETTGGALTVNTTGTVTLAGITSVALVTVDAGAQGSFDSGAEASSVTLTSAGSLPLGNIFSTGAISLTSTGTSATGTISNTSGYSIKTTGGTLTAKTLGAINLTGISASGAITMDYANTTYSTVNEASSISLAGSTLNLSYLYSLGTVSIAGDTITYHQGN